MVITYPIHLLFLEKTTTRSREPNEELLHGIIVLQSETKVMGVGFGYTDFAKKSVIKSFFIHSKGMTTRRNSRKCIGRIGITSIRNMIRMLPILRRHGFGS